MCYKKILTLLILAIYALMCCFCYQNTKIKNKTVPTHSTINPTPIKQDKEQPIYLLEIPKINLRQEVFALNSYNNTIEKHVTLLNESILPPQEPSRIILAAHSGPDPIAFFDHLDQLTEMDTLFLTDDNTIYHYQVTSIIEQEKDGFIRIPKQKEAELILTTCSKTKQHIQLIILCRQTKRATKSNS